MGVVHWHAFRDRNGYPYQPGVTDRHSVTVRRGLATAHGAAGRRDQAPSPSGPATTEDDTGSLDVWVPLPVAPGPYFIRLILASDGARLASMDSSPFG